MTPATLFMLACLSVQGLSARKEISLPPEIREALEQNVAIPGAKIVPVAFAAPKRCTIRHASVAQPIDGSGRVAVKYVGNGCSGYAWVDLALWADVPVTLRRVAKGESLTGAYRLVPREVRRGQPVFIPEESAVAGRPLSAGETLLPRDLQSTGERAGGVVDVVVTTGALAVRTQGRRIPCGQGRVCAVLPSGKRVEGTLDESDRLLVVMP